MSLAQRVVCSENVFPHFRIELADLDLFTCDLFDQELQHIAFGDMAQDVVVLLAQVIAIRWQDSETNG